MKSKAAGSFLMRRSSIISFSLFSYPSLVRVLWWCFVLLTRSDIGNVGDPTMEVVVTLVQFLVASICFIPLTNIF